MIKPCKMSTNKKNEVLCVGDYVYYSERAQAYGSGPRIEPNLWDYIPVSQCFKQMYCEHTRELAIGTQGTILYMFEIENWGAGHDTICYTVFDDEKAFFCSVDGLMKVREI